MPFCHLSQLASFIYLTVKSVSPVVFNEINDAVLQLLLTNSHLTIDNVKNYCYTIAKANLIPETTSDKSQKICKLSIHKTITSAEGSQGKLAGCWYSSAPVFQWWCSTPQGSPGIGRNTFLSSPHLCFIIVFICDLFVSRDDPLMS